MKFILLCCKLWYMMMMGRLADLNDFKTVNEIYAKCKRSCHIDNCVISMIIFFCEGINQGINNCLKVYEWFNPIFSFSSCRFSSSISGTVNLSSGCPASKCPCWDRMHCNPLNEPSIWSAYIIYSTLTRYGFVSSWALSTLRWNKGHLHWSLPCWIITCWDEIKGIC